MTNRRDAENHIADRATHDTPKQQQDTKKHTLYVAYLVYYKLIQQSALFFFLLTEEFSWKIPSRLRFGFRLLGFLVPKKHHTGRKSRAMGIIAGGHML